MKLKIVSTLTLLLCCQLTLAREEFYTAAVFAHNPFADGVKKDVSSRDEALKVMMANLDVLETQTAKAEAEGTDIFVFPEYGLIGLKSFSNEMSLSYFVEKIPDPKINPTFCPCDSGEMPGQEVLYRLSCMAKNHSMYIAVNMGDKQPCVESCPLTGHYQYNTEAVFNPSGCLVAKYHKENLFLAEKLFWNVPKTVDISYFDTEFGRFGLMICFDAVFQSPAVDLVEKYNVTDIIFSTAWMNVYPHYISTAYHSGWARTMRVNYLSSNIQYPELRYLGSGIYSPNGVLGYTFNQSSTTGQLVIARVPLNVNRTSPKPPANIQTNFVSENTFSSKIFDDTFLFVPVSGLSGNISVCSGTVCCHLEFTRSDTNEFYALGLFNGMHYLEGEYYLEVCLLVRCESARQNCGTALQNTTTTTFTSYELTGSMNTPYAFPEVVSPDMNFTTDWEFGDEGYVKTISGENKRLASVVLMARNFDKDPSLTNSTIDVIPNSADYIRVSSCLMLLTALWMMLRKTVDA
ncbi:VNN1 [Bugula neritina]|uniref:VNN1 n=1 Tax=Bugula neritina TaxID=10212 RepID=A0A7J7K6M9_BUGNE|nr:VNN1 [Bugula neritina]